MIDIFKGGEDQLRKICRELVETQALATKIITCINPHSYYVAYFDTEFYLATKQSYLNLCDGIGVKLIEKLLFNRTYHRTTGLMLTNTLLDTAVEKKAKVMFIGSTNATLVGVREHLSKHYPQLTVHTHSPPFLEKFDDEAVQNIVKVLEVAEPKILFVGLTAPKQEKLSVQIANSQNNLIIANVGAVFDYLSDGSKLPPIFVRLLGLEWMWRLIMNPKKMWRRTFISLPGYIGLRLLDRLREK